MDVCPVFIDETGDLDAPRSEQPVFGIGMLLVSSQAEITDAFYKVHFGFRAERSSGRSELLADIRRHGGQLTEKELNEFLWSTRHHEYKFSEITSHNTQEYIDLLNIYFSFSGMEFHALLVDRRNPPLDLKRWDNDWWLAYGRITAELVRRRLRRPAFLIVDLQGQPGQSDVNLEDILCEVPMVAGCLRATSETSIWLQLVDLLIGAVQFDWRDHLGEQSKPSIRGNAKRQIVDFIKVRLGLPKGMPFLTKSLPYRRSTRTTVFSAWRYVPNK